MFYIIKKEESNIFKVKYIRMDMKLFNCIIIIIFICNYIFIHFGVNVLIVIWILLLCIFFILFFKLNFAKINFKNFDYILIIFKKVINIISLLILFLNFNHNWMLYIDYIVENGLEDNEKVNEAVDKLELTNNQKYYLKIGCVITGIIFSIIFGYYISQNYEIFKPVENVNSSTESVASLSEDLNSNISTLISDVNNVTFISNNEEKSIYDNDDLFIDLNNIILDDNNKNNEMCFLAGIDIDPKEYKNSLEVHSLWEALEHFRVNNPFIVEESPFMDEITIENIHYYQVFRDNYYAYLCYMEKEGSLTAPEYITLVKNTNNAYWIIPEVATKIHMKWSKW